VDTASVRTVASHEGLKGENGRHRPETARLPEPLDLPSDLVGQARRLVSRVRRERVVLVRVVLGEHVEPSRLLEDRDDREPAHEAGQPGGRRDADHGREQDDAGRRRERGAFRDVERVLDDERSAVGVADEIERFALTDPAPNVSGADACGGAPVFPLDLRQRSRDGSMARHPERQRINAAVAEDFREPPHAVRSVRQPMDQERAAANLGRRELVRAVPVAREAARARETPGEVSVGEGPVLGRQALLDLFVNLPEDLILAVQVVLQSERLPHFRGVQLRRGDEPVPGLQVGRPTRFPESQAHDRQQDDRNEDGGAAEPAGEEVPESSAGAHPGIIAASRISPPLPVREVRSGNRSDPKGQLYHF
jgi:hypothetical protein